MFVKDSLAYLHTMVPRRGAAPEGRIIRRSTLDECCLPLLLRIFRSAPHFRHNDCILIWDKMGVGGPVNKLPPSTFHSLVENGTRRIFEQTQLAMNRAKYFFASPRHGNEKKLGNFWAVRKMSERSSRLMSWRQFFLLHLFCVCQDMFLTFLIFWEKKAKHDHLNWHPFIHRPESWIDTKAFHFFFRYQWNGIRIGRCLIFERKLWRQSNIKWPKLRWSGQIIKN